MHISGYCPRCTAKTQFTEAPIFSVQVSTAMGSEGQVFAHYAVQKVEHPSMLNVLGYVDMKREWWWLAKCNACHLPVLVKTWGEKIFPNLLPQPVDKNIPDPMRKDLAQAKRCLVVEAFDAAATMARRALQSMTVSLGAPHRVNGRTVELWKQIVWLQENGHITRVQRTSTEASRWLGNHGAHENEPDMDEHGNPFVTDVSKEDAEAAIMLVEQLMHSIYVQPAMAKDQLEKRGRDELGRPKPKVDK